MTLRHLKIFLKVYQTENITRASEALSMAQPAVSRTIQEIETYYGVRLFERTNRRLHVTEAGKHFYTYALHILASFEELERGMRNWDELGVLRVGTSVTNGNALLPKVLKQFREAHPNLQIKATVSNGTKLQQALLDNELDFAVIEGYVHDEALCKQEIAPDQLVLIMPPDDPRKDLEAVTLKDFEGDSLILREEGSMGRNLVSQVFELHGLSMNPTIESVSTQTIIRAVHEGLGVSFLPEQLVQDAIANGFVSTKILSDESFRRRNYIVWHKQKFLTQSAKALMNTFSDMSWNVML